LPVAAIGPLLQGLARRGRGRKGGGQKGFNREDYHPPGLPRLGGTRVCSLTREHVRETSVERRRLADRRGCDSHGGWTSATPEPEGWRSSFSSPRERESQLAWYSRCLSPTNREEPLGLSSANHLKNIREERERERERGRKREGKNIYFILWNFHLFSQHF